MSLNLTTNNPGLHFREGDVVVDATGQAGYIKQSVFTPNLYAALMAETVFGSARELPDLEYPVTIVARNGDPTFTNVVDAAPLMTYTAQVKHDD